MKRLFHITSDSATPLSEQVLLCELSHYHICLASADGSTKEITRLSYYESAQPLTAAEIEQAFSNDAFKTKDFKGIVAGSAYPNTMLVPKSLLQQSGQDKSATKDNGELAFTDVLEAQDLAVVYSIPAAVYNSLNVDGAIATTSVFTPLLKLDNDFAEESMVMIHFTGKEFRVLAKKGAQVLLAQIYAYATPLDVVYYLLVICSQYNLSQSETAIILSGFIDEDSALYKELYQYFSKVYFAKETSFSIPGNEHQHHFFSSILNLATCVL